MSTLRSRTFKSGNSEAIRIPKGLGFGIDVDVTLVKSGEVLTIFASRPPISELIETLNRLPKPPQIEERDIEPLEERIGL